MASEEPAEVKMSREPPPVERFRPVDIDHMDWSALRAECPVSRVRTAGGEPAWLVTRYRDIRAVLGSQTFSVQPIDMESGSGTYEANESIFQDPPEHTRLRGLVAGPFAVGRVEQYRDAIQKTAYALIESMKTADGPIDLMERFAKPLTINVIGEVVGVPAPDRDMFRRGSDKLLVPMHENGGAEAREGWHTLNDYVMALIARRRRENHDPRADLIGHLISSQTVDEKLTDVEVTTMVLGLPVAGYVSTANAIAVAVRHLVEDGWMDRLRAAPDVREQSKLFVEEVLRIQSGDNGESMPRFAAGSFEVGGTTINKGDIVVAPLIAANRDESMFDRPGTFDPHREGLSRHIAFGFGIHRCLGANLARLELQIAVDALVESGICFELLERWDEVPWRQNMLGDRFPERLMVGVSVVPAGGEV
ncbi:cytochrome P450 [Nonomuraea terrae]|uniref:cytochrome P450 n=1 Tax=Nonomuraea terrae TaxID=2530383 RepID=UPI0037A7B91F